VRVAIQLVTLALSPIRDTLIEGFSYFVTSIAAPVASGWERRRVGLAPTGKRRLSTAHTLNGHSREALRRLIVLFLRPETTEMLLLGQSSRR
jgi:hypothetical protein